MDIQNLEYLVVGAGLWGATLAERIAKVLNKKVLVIEKRPHIGGNCYSHKHAETGIEIHAYGSHIFHTANQRVWEYVTGFSEFTSYKHKVFTEYKNRVYSIPISLATINAFYECNLKPYEAEAFIQSEVQKENIQDPPNNLEEKAISLIGRPLYEAFIKGYTLKQWNKDPKELPAEIITRLPIRNNFVTDYFNDPWQGLPKAGYGEFFTKMLTHENIELRCGVDFAEIAHIVPKSCCVLYSGPIDALFAYARGVLEWRSLRFELETLPYADYQGTAVMNKADISVPYTRIHEFKHLHPERGRQGDNTVIMREYPKDFVMGDEPYYPVATQKNKELLAAYQSDLSNLPHLILGGRLGGYRYMDMDKTIASALECFDSIKEKRL